MQNIFHENTFSSMSTRENEEKITQNSFKHENS